jgi:hypothetical protein
MFLFVAALPADCPPSIHSRVYYWHLNQCIPFPGDGLSGFLWGSCSSGSGLFGYAMADFPMAFAYPERFSQGPLHSIRPISTNRKRLHRPFIRRANQASTFLSALLVRANTGCQIHCCVSHAVQHLDRSTSLGLISSQ